MVNNKVPEVIRLSSLLWHALFRCFLFIGWQIRGCSSITGRYTPLQPIAFFFFFWTVWCLFRQNSRENPFVHSSQTPKSICYYIVVRLLLLLFVSFSIISTFHYCASRSTVFFHWRQRWLKTSPTRLPYDSYVYPNFSWCFFFFFFFSTLMESCLAVWFRSKPVPQRKESMASEMPRMTRWQLSLYFRYFNYWCDQGNGEYRRAHNDAAYLMIIYSLHVTTSFFSNIRLLNNWCRFPTIIRLNTLLMYSFQYFKKKKKNCVLTRSILQQNNHQGLSMKVVNFYEWDSIHSSEYIVFNFVLK